MFEQSDPSALRTLPLPSADIAYATGFLRPEQADVLFAQLQQEIPWRQPKLYIHGRHVLTPRLCCWMGDPGAVYRYSNTRFLPEPWTAAVQALKSAVEAMTGNAFNSVLLNYYRDGRDAMGWHSDDEPELGPQPVIASVSIGGVRRFLLRPRSGGASSGIALAHGSLLLMRGDTQKNYQHSLPRTSKPVDGRINLTFRKIHQ
ncbi:alpha-ketoglutarate-dependent dioxygenase AlkB family protein [Arenimonas sp.]|jgi:alkylated DNA repair dioxygenase AlkB|uniref:alpha-ketoglutarate-dependent dioxygenase AlkB family protein n=1 Tax=Arenimonas sp. TaxID=1872635 RepID=UPI0037BF7DC5